MPLDRLQSMVSTGQFLAAYREVERLVLDPGLDPDLRARVYILGVRAAAGLREIYSAAKMAEKAVECAELGTNWDDIGSARLHSALIYRELGDTALALRFFQLFFSHLDRYPSLQSKTGHAYYNMGLTYQQRKEYDQALQSYGLAMEDFGHIGFRAGVLASLQNCAWVLLLQNQPEEAQNFIDQAEAVSTALGDPEYQTTQLTIEALHARHTGRPDRATALCEEVFQPGREGVLDRHRAAAAWIMAALSLQAGQVHEAALFADLAVGYALQAKDPHLMNLASEALQKVRLIKGELST